VRVPEKRMDVMGMTKVRGCGTAQRQSRADSSGSSTLARRKDL
jgi:hypothetical protein